MPFGLVVISILNLIQTGSFLLLRYAQSITGDELSKKCVYFSCLPLACSPDQPCAHHIALVALADESGRYR
jgi:hypothetical protein